MKVSVILPIYNTEKYLEECLDSLMNQTLKDLEVIAVDDGSTDACMEILKEYEKRYPDKLKVFHKENGGQSTARNLALPFASGEFLGFVDSDDWVEIDMFEKMYQKAEAEKTDIVICDMVDHYPDHVVYHHASEYDNKFKITPSACNKIFRKTIIEKDTFPEGLWYEDFEFTTKQLMKTDKISVCHKGFYHCHCREVSTMSNNNAVKNLDILQVLDDLEQFMKVRKWEERYKDVLEYLYIDHVLITSINRLENQKNNEKRTVIRKMALQVRKKYPCFYKDIVYKQMPLNRKVIAFLNAYGFSKISSQLLKMKGKVTNIK